MRENCQGPFYLYLYTYSTPTKLTSHNSLSWLTHDILTEWNLKHQKNPPYEKFISSLRLFLIRVPYYHMWFGHIIISELIFFCGKPREGMRCDTVCKIDDMKRKLKSQSHRFCSHDPKSSIWFNHPSYTLGLALKQLIKPARPNQTVTKWFPPVWLYSITHKA